MLAEKVARWVEEWKAEGLKAGLEEGRAEGRVEGRAEGCAEGRVAAILDLVRSGALPAAAALTSLGGMRDAGVISAAQFTAAQQAITSG